MTQTLCVIDQRPVADQAYACAGCLRHAERALADIADMVPAARDIATGQARHGGRGGSGKPGSQLPLDLTATAKLDAVQGSLTTRARHIAEIRGGQLPRGGDPTAHAARFLAGQLGWMAHRAEVDEFVADVDAALRVVRGLARGPAEMRYLGPCGAPIAPEPREPGAELVAGWVDEVCPGDVYAPRGASGGRCRLCGAEVASGEREAWLDGEVRSRAFRPAHIADAYGVKDNTIVKWHARGKLKAYWVTGTGLTVEWTDPPLDPELTGDAKAEREAEIAAELKARGPKVFYVGDVLDLAAAEAVRRHEAATKRQRRAAQDQAA